MASDGAVLSARQLNRSVLARQLLLERADLDVATALQRTGGLQTQYAPSGYVGLWSRLTNFQRDDLTNALESRAVVQGTLMRVTIHMVAASDYWAICAGVRTSRRQWWERIVRSRRLGEIPHDELAAVLRSELAEGPRSATELIDAMQARGYPKSWWEGAGLWLDMVRVPPSGTWERRRADRYGLAEQWVRPVRRPSERAGLRLLLSRYLGGFGPARLSDAASWAGVTRSRMEAAATAMELRTFRNEAGAELVDLVDAELPDADTPTPVRFLPTWDALLLVHCRQAGILPEALRPAIFSPKYPQSVGTVLVDGTVAATWAWRKDHVAVDHLRPLAATDRRRVDDEAQRLAEFYRD